MGGWNISGVVRAQTCALFTPTDYPNESFAKDALLVPKCNLKGADVVSVHVWSLIDNWESSLVSSSVWALAGSTSRTPLSAFRRIWPLVAQPCENPQAFRLVRVATVRKPESLTAAENILSRLEIQSGQPSFAQCRQCLRFLHAMDQFKIARRPATVLVGGSSEDRDRIEERTCSFRQTKRGS